MRHTKGLAAALVVLALPSIARAESAPPCPNDDWISAMMVPNKYVAESIYRAVGGALVPWNFKRYPIVLVEDAGDHWALSQTDGKPSVSIVPRTGGIETVTVSVGGGQLNLDINKCTGAISHAALVR
jgi:hypothetical protein